MKCFAWFDLWIAGVGCLWMQLQMGLLQSHALHVGLSPSWLCDEGHAGVAVSLLAPLSPLQSSLLCQQMLCIVSRAVSAYSGPFSLLVSEVITATPGCEGWWPRCPSRWGVVITLGKHCYLDC